MDEAERDPNREPDEPSGGAQPDVPGDAPSNDPSTERDPQQADSPYRPSDAQEEARVNQLVHLWEQPAATELYMVCGWQQWADAGAISSGLPEYLIDHFKMRRIGEIRDDGFYLFQIPGTHHFLRPEITMREGYQENLERNTNEIYYMGDDRKGLIVFQGVEPHLNVERYAAAFFAAVAQLNVKRTIAVGGVYGAMPYNRDREVSCVYSLKWMKAEMLQYSVRLSGYQGGATIGSYLLDQAEQSNAQYLAYHAFVPAYDFSDTPEGVQGIRLENDYRAWHELMRRVNHMTSLGLDLSDLAQLSDELDQTIETKLAELDREMPHLKVRAFLEEINVEFQEKPFAPLDDIWEEELGDLFDEGE